VRSKRTLVILTAVLAAFAAGAFAAGYGHGIGRTPSAGNAMVPQAMSSSTLESLLGTSLDQPPNASFYGPMTVKDAVAAHLFGPASGISSDPPECLQSTDAIGNLSTVQGYVIAGERSAMIAPDSLQRFFTTAVFQIPGGASGVIDRLSAILAKCSAGTTTVGNANGTMSYAQSEAPAVGSARTYQSTLTTVLPFNGTDAQCVAEVTLATTGDLLIWSVEPTPSLAQQAVNSVYSRYTQAQAQSQTQS
jgi:hypothetical protein